MDLWISEWGTSRGMGPRSAPPFAAN